MLHVGRGGPLKARTYELCEYTRTYRECKSYRHKTLQLPLPHLLFLPRPTITNDDGVIASFQYDFLLISPFELTEKIRRQNHGRRTVRLLLYFTNRGNAY